MAYMSLIAHCFVCQRLFTSNPDYVPSYQNEPVCEACMARVNAQRVEQGLEPHPIHPLAYEPQETDA